jgi:hypothetical protein
MGGATRGFLAALFLLLPFTIALAASPLPSDPAQWTCTNPEPPPQDIARWCAENMGKGEPADLGVPGPGTLLNLNEKNTYDIVLRQFYENRDYALKLKWAQDKQWRLTGPLVGQLPTGTNHAQFESYGVHPVVRIYYSPEVVQWLCNGRQGPVKDGAMLIKEMLSIGSVQITADAKQCMAVDQASAEQSLQKGNLSWAVMVKASQVSRDGWYWSSPNKTPLGNPPLLDKSAVTVADFFGSGPVQPNPNWYPTGDLFQPLANGATKQSDVVYPYNMYGAYCLNCHATTQNESTYASVDNLLTNGIQYKFFPSSSPKSMLLTFSRTFHSGHADPRTLFDILTKSVAPKSPALKASSGYVNPFPAPLPAPTTAFLNFYNMLPPMDFNTALQLRFPAETYDHQMSGPKGPGQFVTSDQCMGCHDATQNNSATPNMLITDADNGLLTVPAASSVNFSPYGEWRVSPMGLAGRDPIFFSQLQSETNTLPQLANCIENTCLHCHGVMGQRQYALDNPDPTAPCRDIFAVPPPPAVPSGKPFARQIVNQWQGTSPHAEVTYGALARDGISCAVCHHIADVELGKEPSFTGNFVTSAGDTVFGPYKDKTVATAPMKHALAITPQFGKQVASSDMCGTCHNILLPVFNNDGTRHSFTVNGKTIQSTYEQTTHLEWGNSDFNKPGESFRSCQNCHMPRHYADKKGQPKLLTNIKIANSEDNTFPPTTHRLATKDITLTPRQTFGRHALHGANVFLNAMFQQFPLLLGLRQLDYMITSSAQPALITGQNSMVQMAQQETATVQILNLVPSKETLTATVLVTNKAGHYLPSGVGFRRAFLELVAEDKAGIPLWASGRTNELGVLLDGISNTPLPSENVYQNPRTYLPHYQQITQGDQAQIYQEVILDSEQNVTTSFLRRVTTVKDNRLRPKGYDPAVFARNPSPYIQELAEGHGVTDDPYYQDPKLTGADQLTYVMTLPPEQLARVHTVRATLYYQAVPPMYLQQRFTDASKGPAQKEDIQRLYYLTSHLNTNAVMTNWKLTLATTERTLSQGH